MLFVYKVYIKYIISLMVYLITIILYLKIIISMSISVSVGQKKKASLGIL